VSTPADVWAIVEIFGHRKLAGRVSKSNDLFPLLRIDVPETSLRPAFTVEYGANAIFSIAYVSQAIAAATAEALKVDPINIYAPELITREQYDAVQHEVERLRTLHTLPSPNVRPFEREDWGGEQDDQDDV
jgi:hypothetical protein